MKNRVLIACVVGGLGATPMTASAVDVYGKAHISADYVDAGAGSHAALSSNSSRIGFKGTEKITESVEVLWRFESEIDITNDAFTGLKARNRYVGLAGRYGTVIAGYFDTPFKDVGKLAGLMHDTIADRRAILGTGSDASSAKKITDIRAKNAVMYMSPDLNGLKLRILQSAGEDSNPDGTDANRVTSLSAIYKLGNTYVAGAYVSNDSTEVDAYRVGAGIVLGKTSINAIYEQLSTDGDSKYDRPAYGAAISHPIGNVMLKAQAYVADDNDAVENSGGMHFGLGAFRKIAKTTEIYTVVAMTQNEENARFVLAGSGHGDKYTPAEAGDDPYGVSVGLIYKF